MESSQDPHSEISTLLNLTVVLTHSSKVILPFEDISHPGVRSHTTTQSRLDSGPNAPPRGDFIHHRSQIEVNFFESRNLLR